jgi:unsaturated rhamnogalacturonyl hydrolase
MLIQKKVILFLICSFLATVTYAQKKTVLLDYYFNNEYKKNDQGEFVRFHYTWEDTAQSGYSKLGALFTQNGFTLKSLTVAPDAANLKNASIYLIVDPDTEKETAIPHFIEKEHIKEIRSFINEGGIVVVMANDSGNVEFNHLNQLTETFGIHLNGDSKSKVYNDKYEMAAFQIPINDPIFTNSQKVYLKEVSSLQLSKNALPILKHQSENYVVGAKANFGKGMIIVIGDPWFYNEYLNGRLGYTNGWDNEKAAIDFIHWLVKNTH